MSTIAATETRAAGEGASVRATPGSDRERSPVDADFGAFFAQFAQTTAMGAARNGSMSLAIGRPGGTPTPGAQAQELPGGPAETAHQESVLRKSPEAAPALQASRGQPGEQAGPGRERGPAGSAGAERRADADAEEPSNRRSPGERRPTAGEAERAGKPAGPSASGAGAGATAAQGAGAALPAGSTGAPTPTAGNTQIPGVSALGKIAGAGQTNGGAGALLGHLQNQAKAGASGARTPQSQPGAPQTAQFRAQLAQGLGAALRQGRGQVTLRLTPESLGQIEVRVRVSGSTVHARITASTIEAQRLLEQNIDSLRQSFEARGLQPGKIEIQPSPEGREAHGEDQQPGGQEGTTGGGGEGQRPSEEPAGGRGAFAGGGPGPSERGGEAAAALDGHGNPGVVYGVADGAARIVMVDALA